MIKENFYINAVVSSGSKFVELPDFRGRDLAEVKELIQSLDLRLTDQDIEYVRDRDSEPGMVIGQVPEPRKSVERRTAIKLKVSNGNERVTSDGRSNVSKNYNISVEVPALLDAAVLVRIEMTDDRGTKTVYEDNNNPGDTIEEESRGYGTEVIFRIFFDNELVKQITKTPGDE
ncbi:MAG: PASTA domain-containing protein [Fimbriimonadaceae bacterium]